MQVIILSSFRTFKLLFCCNYDAGRLFLRVFTFTFYITIFYIIIFHENMVAMIAMIEAALVRFIIPFMLVTL